jgi:hypothetical protein
MKFISSAIICLLTYCSASAQLDLWRNTYFQSGSNDGKKKYIEILKSHQPGNALEKAYKGAAIAMAAEFESSVNRKFEVFGQGKKMIEEAVSMDYYNPEIRFLRFSVQTEVPWIVQYKNNIEEDYWRIVGAFDARMVDPKTDFWKKAISFMLNSDDLRTEQKEKLKAYQL